MASTDFNGDGRDDILWRNADGLITDWLATSDGSFVNNWAQLHASVPSSWMIAATGDFNGDGQSDILWIENGGKITNWLGTTAGGFVANWGNALIDTPSDRVVAGVGDFNGDGRDDTFLWSYTGEISVWRSTVNGGFDTSAVSAAPLLPISWNVAGVGDFNGDDLADVLWRNAETGEVTNWLSTGTGFVSNTTAHYGVPKDWSIVGLGDFNGDDHDDILWRRDDGVITNWLGTNSGSFTANWANFHSSSDPHWQVESIGDFNGDGRADIFWRSDSGGITDWLGTATGGFVGNWDVFNMTVGQEWTVPPDWNPWAY